MGGTPTPRLPRGGTRANIFRGESLPPAVPAWDSIPSEELDADERQDEILANAGVYPLPARPGMVWKFLVVFGAIVAILGFLFWLRIGGLRLPDVSALPWALGSLMAIFLLALGLVCLVAGVVLGGRYHRDPYEMRPIR